MGIKQMVKRPSQPLQPTDRLAKDAGSAAKHPLPHACSPLSPGLHVVCREIGPGPCRAPPRTPRAAPRLAARPHACSPPMTANEDDERLARLRAEAEAEMRRRLPTEGGGRAAKRRKTGGEEAERQAGGRFDYGAIQELTTGITGFLLTCQLQR